MVSETKGLKIESGLAAKEDIEKILQLVARIYRESGYFKTDSVPVSWKSTLFSENTSIFVVKVNGVIVGTVSVIHDTGNIPMDLAFHDELEILRSKGKISEVGKLAIDKELLKSLIDENGGKSKEHELFQRISITLFGLVYLEGLMKGSRYLCIAVLEKHSSFYETALLFEKIGEPRGYSTSPDIPATIERPMALDYSKRSEILAKNGGRINMFYDAMARMVPELKSKFRTNTD